MVSLSGFVAGALRIIRSLPQRMYELVKTCMSHPAERSERIEDLPAEPVQDDLQVEAGLTLVTMTEGPTSVLVGRIEELEEQVGQITLDRDAAIRRLQRARGAVQVLQAELLVHSGIIRRLEAQWQGVVTGFQCNPVPPRENRVTADEGDASLADRPNDPEAFYRTRSGRCSKPPHLLTWVMQHQLFLRISEVLNKCQMIYFVVYLLQYLYFPGTTTCHHYLNDQLPAIINLTYALKICNPLQICTRGMQKTTGPWKHWRWDLCLNEVTNEVLYFTYPLHTAEDA